MGWGGRSISVNRERPKREGRFLLTQRGKTGGEDFCELYCEAAPPYPRIRPPYTFCQPLLLFLSSHGVTRASSRGREEEKPRVRGNRGMGE